MAQNGLSDRAEVQRRKLHARGLTDKEIADRVGRAHNTITIWRQRRGLPLNRPTAKERFDEKWVENEDGCWVWTASKYVQGYGRFTYKGRRCKAHRVAMRLYTDKDVDSWYVLHENMDGKSHRKDCVNPDHLYIGDQADNMEDYAKSEDHVSKKLTIDEVHMIRLLYTGGEFTQRDLGEMFDTSWRNVGEIVRGENWSYAPGPTK